MKFIGSGAVCSLSFGFYSPNAGMIFLNKQQHLSWTRCTVVMMLGKNVSVAFRASVANAGAMALAAKNHGTLTAPNRTSRWILF